MIAPAPRKPMPVTIWAAILVGSTCGPNSAKPYAETMVNSAEPTETTRCVRRPACRSRNSRSAPTAAPSTAATPKQSTMCPQPSVGTAAARLRKIKRDSFCLQLGDPPDPGLGEAEQLVERRACERIALGRRLHLY